MASSSQSIVASYRRKFTFVKTPRGEDSPEEVYSLFVKGPSGHPDQFVTNHPRNVYCFKEDRHPDIVLVIPDDPEMMKMVDMALTHLKTAHPPRIRRITPGYLTKWDIPYKFVPLRHMSDDELHRPFSDFEQELVRVFDEDGPKE